MAGRRSRIPMLMAKIDPVAMNSTRAGIALTTAEAESELADVREQVEEARIALLVWRRALAEAEQTPDGGQTALLIEANEQLILAALAARSEVDATSRALDELAESISGHAFPATPAEAGGSPQLSGPDEPETDSSDREPLSADHQRRHAQLREANTALILAALDAQTLQTAAERLLRQQKEALAVVAHELRTPLTPIRIASDMLGRVRPDEMKRYQDIIESEIEHMVAVISDLLDVSRFETGKLRIDRQPVDLTRVVAAATDACRPAMDDRQQKLTVDLPAQAIELEADPVRLTQILRNLLDNASKYTPNGGQIALSAELVADSAVISVSDTGIGITAEALASVFEPFTQEVHAMRFNAVGLGLGLAVVRELVTAHDGNVVARSEGLGRGTRFVVTLPSARYRP